MATKPRIRKPPIAPVHRSLRTATRDDLATIDRMLLRFDLNRVEDYKVFLRVQHAAMSRLQDDWRVEDVEDFTQMLKGLSSDLKALEVAVDGQRPITGKVTNVSKGLGIAYVIRSLRLAAAPLRRDIVAPFPTAYLDFIPALPWQAFVRELELIGDNAVLKLEAVQAARRAGSAFVNEYLRLGDLIELPRNFGQFNLPLRALPNAPDDEPAY